MNRIGESFQRWSQVKLDETIVEISIALIVLAAGMIYLAIRAVMR